MPPRHGKTESVTKPLPLWYLKHRPGTRILITGYSMAFARKLSRSIRNRAASLGIVIAEDKSATDEWYTEDGSMVMARGVGNVPTGEGFDLIIADDPIRDRKQADSLVWRESLWDWWTEGLMSRLQPGGTIVCIWTLWHEDDPAGRMDAQAKEDSKADQWTVEKLAALAEENDSLGRKPGEALWPEAWSVDALENRRASMMRSDGLRAWEALYQQNPTPREGSLFKPAKVRFCDPSEVPSGLQTIRRWDMAASTSGDYTAGVKVSGPDKDGFYYVEDVRRGKWEIHDRGQVIRDVALMDGPVVKIIGPQDPGAAGVEAASAFVRMLSGYNVTTERETGSKELRAEPFAAQLNAGNVVIVRGGWNNEFLEELRTFPNGKHDDQVDAASGAFNSLSRPMVRLIG